ncbi:MAG: phosphatidylglycerophosphatase A [Leptolyngbya sp. PLA1]|nr:phosphatidylglycerophosphatase A [Leptolyngbya sp. PLA1]
MQQRSRLALISVFGLGNMRPASGTWGSLPPVIIAAFLVLWGMDPLGAPLVYYGVMGLLVLVFGLGCVLQGDAAEARWGPDPGQVVADEVVGQSLTLMLLPWGAIMRPPLWASDHIMALIIFTLAFAFIAFRVMDIVKPWPARQVQRVPGGWGILLDDVFAGIYAAAVIQLTARLVLR